MRPNHGWTKDAYRHVSVMLLSVLESGNAELIPKDDAVAQENFQRQVRMGRVEAKWVDKYGIQQYELTDKGLADLRDMVVSKTDELLNAPVVAG
jgi:hypothetical protein